jgi:hypothetical protein
MVVIAALAFALGIALAQFYKVLVLAPATIFVGGGVLILELTGGHSAGHTLLSILLAASALQSGFLSGSLFSAFVVGASRAVFRAAPRSK